MKMLFLSFTCEELNVVTVTEHMNMAFVLVMKGIFTALPAPSPSALCFANIDIFHPLSEFSTTEDMLDALRKDEIDGILMDQYMASYVLHEHDDSNDLKVFTNYEAEIFYDLAYPHNSIFMEIFSSQSCVKKNIDKNDVDDLLITYLMPVAVGNNLTPFRSVRGVVATRENYTQSI